MAKFKRGDKVKFKEAFVKKSILYAGDFTITDAPIANKMRKCVRNVYNLFSSNADGTTKMFDVKQKKLIAA